ncbi:MAG: NmrA family NAD(P)-binding protein [Chloroflexi bacterium]|nr:NmrA family NAD(P)-binding protein [Chloroflexota bacterium]
MILLTGASGKTGQAIIQALANSGVYVRGFVRQATLMAHLRQLGAQEIMPGDLRDPAALHRACANVDLLYHICPNMQPDEVAIAQNVIQAAQANGVKRFVYHSVLHPQTAAMPHHWQKLCVEELLFQSGLNFTILQPAAYMQNVLASWPLIREQGIYRTPYATTTRLGMVDLRDVAEAAAKVLTEADHNGAIYELAGAEVLSQTDVAALLTEGLERPVRAEAMAPAIWEQGARQAGLGDYQVATLLKMFKYYEQYGFWGNPRVLTGLLGRAPTTFFEFVQRARQAATDQ